MAIHRQVPDELGLSEQQQRHVERHRRNQDDDLRQGAGEQQQPEQQRHRSGEYPSDAESSADWGSATCPAANA